MVDWYARPVIHVTDCEAAIRFYVDKLGFTLDWHFGEDGRTTVAEVDRGSCALIICEHWPAKAGKGLMFISLNVQPFSRDAEIAAVDALRVEFEGRGLTVNEGHWGYRVLIVADPDGNQLFFPYPNEPGQPPS